MHDLDEEVSNLDRRADATARLVKALDEQLATITEDVDSTSAKVTPAENELAAKRSALQRRLVDIYKRGPLYTTEAMLSARSFGELVARYKYLHLLALHDRALVTRVHNCATRSNASTIASSRSKRRCREPQRQEAGGRSGCARWSTSANRA